jgi:predicted transcriptional regulator
MSKSVTVYLSDDAVTALERARLSARRSRSFIVDELVKAALSATATANPQVQPADNGERA